MHVVLCSLHDMACAVLTKGVNWNGQLSNYHTLGLLHGRVSRVVVLLVP